MPKTQRFIEPKNDHDYAVAAVIMELRAVGAEFLEKSQLSSKDDKDTIRDVLLKKEALDELATLLEVNPDKRHLPLEDTIIYYDSRSSLVPVIGQAIDALDQKVKTSRLMQKLVWMCNSEKSVF